MWEEGVFTDKVPAKEAFLLSKTFKDEMPYDKFKNQFYTCHRGKLEKEEKERTGGMGPPLGTYKCDFTYHC